MRSASCVRGGRHPSKPTQFDPRNPAVHVFCVPARALVLLFHPTQVSTLGYQSIAFEFSDSTDGDLEPPQLAVQASPDTAWSSPATLMGPFTPANFREIIPGPTSFVIIEHWTPRSVSVSSSTRASWSYAVRGMKALGMLPLMHPCVGSQ